MSGSRYFSFSKGLGIEKRLRKVVETLLSLFLDADADADGDRCWQGDGVADGRKCDAKLVEQ